MRNVTRTSKPNSLVRNGTKWSNKLLLEIQRCQNLGITVKEAFYDKYNKQDVKDALNNMYNNYCCYCESQVGIVDYPHIEHRKPKRAKNGVPIVVYPHLTYEWDNLHLSCTICNTTKGNKYDEINPILDSVNDSVIEQHFQYDEGAEGIIWFPLTARASTTEQHTGLNRDAIVRARLAIFRNITIAIIKIKNNPTNPGNTVAINELKKKTKGPYGSLVKFLLLSFEIT